MGGLGLRVTTTVWELGVANVRAAKERGPPSADLFDNSNADGHNEDPNDGPPTYSRAEEPVAHGRRPAEASLAAGGARVRGGQENQEGDGSGRDAAAQRTAEEARGPPARQRLAANQVPRTTKCEDGADTHNKVDQRRNEYAEWRENKGRAMTTDPPPRRDWRRADERGRAYTTEKPARIAAINPLIKQGGGHQLHHTSARHTTVRDTAMAIRTRANKQTSGAGKKPASDMGRTAEQPAP